MTGGHASSEMEKQRETRAAWYADLLKTPKVTAPFQYTIGSKWLDSNFTCANSLGNGAPEGTRTPDPRLRRPVIYPPELRRVSRPKNLSDRSPNRSGIRKSERVEINGADGTLGTAPWHATTSWSRKTGRCPSIDRSCSRTPRRSRSSGRRYDFLPWNVKSCEWLPVTVLFVELTVTAPPAPSVDI
jgi:hypothetical protein